MTSLHRTQQNTLAVHKFGGSSLATSARIQNVASIIASHTQPKDMIVVSANGKMTDWLEAFSQGQSNILHTLADYYEQLVTQTLTDPTPLLTFFRGTLKQLRAAQHNDNELTGDDILAFGELWSANLLAEYLNEQGISARFVDARTLLCTAAIDDYNAFDLNYFDTAFTHLSDTAPNERLIITGFVARNPQGKTTTLGRNGSDYSASLLARFSNAKSVTLWTDVPGIFNADPRLIHKAQPIENLNYAEASALAAIGTNVLHQKTIGPLRHQNTTLDHAARQNTAPENIPLFIRSSLQPELGGTQVSSAIDPQGGATAKSIALHANLIKINIHHNNHIDPSELVQQLRQQQIVSVYAAPHRNNNDGQYTLDDKQDSHQNSHLDTNSYSLLIRADQTQAAIAHLHTLGVLFSTEGTPYTTIAIVGHNIAKSLKMIELITETLNESVNYAVAQQQHDDSILILTTAPNSDDLLKTVFNLCFMQTELPHPAQTATPVQRISTHLQIA